MALLLHYHKPPISIRQTEHISVQPWDKSMLEVMEKAIIDANLGFNPMNNGEMIMINVPPLTEERRIQLVKQISQNLKMLKLVFVILVKMLTMN